MEFLGGWTSVNGRIECSVDGIGHCRCIDFLKVGRAYMLAIEWLNGVDTLALSECSEYLF